MAIKKIPLQQPQNAAFGKKYHQNSKGTWKFVRNRSPPLLLV
jgi:hypothetical protein